MRHLITLLLILALSPAIASADGTGWFTNPNGTIETTGISPGGVRTAYYENDSTTEDSKNLSIAGCEVVTFSLNQDEDGTATTATTVDVWLLDLNTGTCGSKTSGVNVGTLSDASPDFSTRPVRDWACIEITANSATEEFRVTAKCGGSR